MPIALTSLAILLLQACSSDPTQSAEQTPQHPGKQLHTTYCGSCHAIPEPSELDQKTWKDHILVRMGAYMGIYTDNLQYFDSVPKQWVEPGYGGERVRKGNIYPQKSVVTREEWKQLRDYILKNAPEQTTGPSGMPSIQRDGIPGFAVHTIQPNPELQPLVTAVAIDPINRTWYAAFIQQTILQLNREGKIQKKTNAWQGPVQIVPRKSGITVVDIGSMGGSDNPQGKMVTANSLGKLDPAPPKNTFDSLQRPVFVQHGDLDGDGDEDVVLCEFGYHFGELAWHERLDDGSFRRHTLHNDDGALCARIHDFDQDGRLDVMAQFANADERLVLYLNQGEKQFKQHLVARFSPTFGGTYFELTDWDKDGTMDVLLANGDNGDYPPILKSSHGIRLFRNKGKLRFEEEFHIGMNGTYGLRARDFDGDGDLDIAAVSFYPDYKSRPEESFVYYRNEGGNRFSAFTFPESFTARWMVMDAGDLDGDGDEDLVLGAFNVKSADASDATYEDWMKRNIPLVWLENLSQRP